MIIFSLINQFWFAVGIAIGCIITSIILGEEK